jgi:hypothetical protein
MNSGNVFHGGCIQLIWRKSSRFKPATDTTDTPALQREKRLNAYQSNPKHHFVTVAETVIDESHDWRINSQTKSEAENELASGYIEGRSAFNPQ